MSEIPEALMQRARHVAYPDDDNEPLVVGIALALEEERNRIRSDVAKVCSDFMYKLEQKANDQRSQYRGRVPIWHLSEMAIVQALIDAIKWKIAAHE